MSQLLSNASISVYYCYIIYLFYPFFKNSLRTSGKLDIVTLHHLCRGGCNVNQSAQLVSFSVLLLESTKVNKHFQCDLFVHGMKENLQNKR